MASVRDPQDFPDKENQRKESMNKITAKYKTFKKKKTAKNFVVLVGTAIGEYIRGWNPK